MLSVNSVKQSDAQRHSERSEESQRVYSVTEFIPSLRSGQALSEVKVFLIITKRLSVYTKLPCSPLGAGFFILNIFELRIEYY